MDNNFMSPPPVTFSTPQTDVISEPETMDFYSALKEVAEGKVIRRVSWPEDDYALIVDFNLTLHINGQFKEWIITSDGDMAATDWIING